MLGVLVSREDRASEHVGEHLLDLADWREDRDDARPASDGGRVVHRLDGDGDSGRRVELRTFDDLHIYLEGVEAAFSDDVELVAFASRHSGETGPLLTAHPTGNFGPADYGGEADALARAAPNAAARALASLDAYAPEGYDTGLECTHHGPTDLATPSLFVEVGSAEPQWRDTDAARAVASAIIPGLGLAVAGPQQDLEEFQSYFHLIFQTFSPALPVFQQGRFHLASHFDLLRRIAGRPYVLPLMEV